MTEISRRRELTTLAIIVAVLALGGFAFNQLDRARSSDRAEPPATPAPSPADSLVTLDPALTYVSIAVDDTDLNDPVAGLLVNPDGRGRAWERRADLSYIRPGSELVWTTHVGLRRHGHRSRRVGQKPSWRVYFRDDYDSDTTRQPILTALPRAPSRLILRREPEMYPNVIGFAIARQAGALVPTWRLVRVLLNGEDQGDYLAMEHLHPEGWGMTHLGNKDFSMHVYRGTSTDGRYRELSRWVDTTPAHLTMDAVGKRVDIYHMLRHIFTFVFCNTTDWAQGAAILETNTDARWFWLHWDLDHSFRLRRPSSSDRRGIELFITSHRPLELLDVRARIFNRLREEDPSFRTHYVTLVSELLNHRVEASFFNDVTELYGRLLRPRMLRRLRTYLEQRPRKIRDARRRLAPLHREDPPGTLRPG